MGVVVRRGQLQELVDQVAAQVEHDAIAGPAHAELGDVRAHAAQQEHADDRNRQPLGGERIGRLEVAHDRDDEPREQEIAGGDDHHAEDGDAERPSVGADVAQQAGVEVDARHRDRPRQALRRCRESAGASLAPRRSIAQPRAYEQALVQRHEPRGHRGGRQIGDGRQRIGARPRTCVRCEQRRIAAARPSTSRAAADEAGPVRAHELACAAAVAGDHGQAAGQRLQHRVGQRIVERRQDERVGGAVERARIGLRPRERDALRNAEASREPLVVRSGGDRGRRPRDAPVPAPAPAPATRARHPCARTPSRPGGRRRHRRRCRIARERPRDAAQGPD